MQTTLNMFNYISASCDLFRRELSLCVVVLCGLSPDQYCYNKLSMLSGLSRLSYPKTVAPELLRHLTVVTGTNFIEGTGKLTSVISVDQFQVEIFCVNRILGVLTEILGVNRNTRC